MKTRMLILAVLMVTTVLSESTSTVDNLVNAITNNLVAAIRQSNMLTKAGCGVCSVPETEAMLSCHNDKDKLRALVTHDAAAAALLASRVRDVLRSRHNDDLTYDAAVSLLWLLDSRPELAASVITSALASTSLRVLNNTVFVSMLWELYSRNTNNASLRAMASRALATYAGRTDHDNRDYAVEALLGRQMEPGIDPPRGVAIVTSWLAACDDWNTKQKYYLMLHRAGLLSKDKQDEVAAQFHSKERPLLWRYMDAPVLLEEGLVTSNDVQRVTQEYDCYIDGVNSAGGQ